jgi:hypothetical protein
LAWTGPIIGFDPLNSSFTVFASNPCELARAIAHLAQGWHREGAVPPLALRAGMAGQTPTPGSELAWLGKP